MSPQLENIAPHENPDVHQSPDTSIFEGPSSKEVDAAFDSFSNLLKHQWGTELGEQFKFYGEKLGINFLGDQERLSGIAHKLGAFAVGETMKEVKKECEIAKIASPFDHFYRLESLPLGFSFGIDAINDKEVTAGYSGVIELTDDIRVNFATQAFVGFDGKYGAVAEARIPFN